MTRPPRPFPVLATGACAVVAALLCLVACTSTQKAATTSVSTPSSATPTPSATAHHAVAPRNPLTGIGPVPRTPLIAVKIDDTAPGRPQVGIDKADVVYVEAVEGGLDRLNALFGTSKPTVGYVRSTRPSDPELLKQYGNITEAFSGGESVSKAILARSGIKGWSMDFGSPYFYRVSRAASDYINVELNLAAMAKHIKTPRPRSNGWTFSSSLAGLPTSTGTNVHTVVTGSYSTGTPVDFRWDPKLGRYVRYIGGVAQRAADGRLVTAVNVVVQSCQVTSFAADKDVNHNPAQYTHTVGSGPVSVFRQGKRIAGTWTRPKVTAGTTLRLANGRRIPLHPGNTWVVLIRKGIPVTG